MKTTSARTCRLTVVGPHRSMDTSVPADALLADLLPTLLTQLGAELADRGLEHGGWVLQRLGEPPLDEDRTPEELGLRDGELVHLRPRADLLPPIDFDDLVDGVATGMRERAAAWRPAMTVRATWLSVAGVLCAGGGLLLLPGSVQARAVTAWLTALILSALVLTGGRRPQPPLAVVWGLGATLNAAVGAVLLPAAVRALGGPATPAAWVGLLAWAAVTLVVAFGCFGTGRVALVAIGSAATWLVVAGGLLMLLAGRGVAGASALLCLTVAVRSLVPSVAFRLGGLQLDPLPTTTEDLQTRIDPVPSAPLLASAATADRIMTALYAGIGATGFVAEMILLARPGWATTLLVAAAAVNQVLTVRPMTSARHRLALGLPAGLAALGAVVDVVLLGGPQVQPVAHVTLLAAAIAIALAGKAMADGRLSPVPGRVADLLQTVSGVALIPLALWGFGLYTALRNVAA